ncbi:MAG: UDP-N-acetylmuramoyl-tripeptide--D-alanyl-D-alanine ligase [Rhabdochlamydiaceae bacterium]|nr:UDP-N-acetylmuramoyl-tripeptide--D-alanyl-D-alanine ligase [Rhabdochlamydiaceae bacterium]
MEKMHLKQMAYVLGGDPLPDLPIEGFAVDSRLVLPGSVFFALKGAHSDGHCFLEEVKRKGAICAVVSKEFSQEIPGLLLLKVEDVLASLHKLATWKMSQKKTRCIAVTGSVGKTTTKEFISTLLEGAFTVQKTPGSANSQIGFPLSILNATGEGEFFVTEMGMSEKGNIANLIKIAPPEFVVMTKVALAHSLFFPGGLEEIAEAKAEILSHSHTRKAFIHMQARQFPAFQQQEYFEKVFYGLSSDEFVQSGDVLLQQAIGCFYVEKERDRLTKNFALPFTARHLSENFLVAALVAREVGMSWEQIFVQAQLLAPYKMRFEAVPKDGVLYINDAYNANPESMKAALQNLPAPQKGGKVIAVLGEMRELGAFSQAAHQEIGKIAASHADLLLCLVGDAVHMGTEFSKSGKPSQFFLTLKELQKELLLQVKPGDVVLVKASKSLKMWEVLEEIV